MLNIVYTERLHDKRFLEFPQKHTLRGMFSNTALITVIVSVTKYNMTL